MGWPLSIALERTFPAVRISEMNNSKNLWNGFTENLREDQTADCPG